MSTTEILALGLVIAVVSFLGFAVENIWLAITKGYIDNRNMCLPFLLGYGLAIAAIYILFGTPKKLWVLGKWLTIKKKTVKRIIYFLLVMLCICIGEIILGKLVEKFCHFYWWDYSWLPLHITRYTSIPTSAGFSVMVVTFMDCVFAPLLQFFMRWEFEILCKVSVSLMALMVVDFVYSAYKMYKNKAMNQRWIIKFRLRMNFQ